MTVLGGILLWEASYITLCCIRCKQLALCLDPPSFLFSRSRPFFALMSKVHTFRVQMSLSVSLYIYMYTSISIYIYIYISLLFFYAHVYAYVHMCIYIYICMLVHLFAHSRDACNYLYTLLYNGTVHFLRTWPFLPASSRGEHLGSRANSFAPAHTHKGHAPVFQPDVKEGNMKNQPSMESESSDNEPIPAVSLSKRSLPMSGLNAVKESSAF